jgi:hypothetical protein
LGRIELGEDEEGEIRLWGEMLIAKCVLKNGESCVEFMKGNGITNSRTQSRSTISRRCGRSVAGARRQRITSDGDVAAADLMEKTWQSIRRVSSHY